MPVKDFPILGFQPDLAQDTAGVLTDSDQVIPTDRGFANGQTATLVGSTFGASRPFGGIEVAKIDGTARQFIGTSTKIHELVAGVATDRSAKAYSASLTQQWTFAQMGDSTLAVNKGDRLQVSTTGAFADAAASAPKASIVTVAGLPNRAFAMLFDYDDGTNNYADGVFWSPSLTNWTPSIASQVGNVRITDVNGKFTAATGYRDGVIAFKSGSMYRGEYVGGSDEWAFTRISSTVGCLSPNALCSAGDVLYFADAFGLWQFDGSYPRPMPGAVHNWFARGHDTEVRMTWDATRHVVWLRYGNDGFGNGMHAAYNVRSQKWAKFGTIGAASHLIGPNYSAAFAGGVSQFQTYGATNANNGVPATLRFGAFGAVYGETMLRSIRPSFLAGPNDTATGWLSGTLYYGPSLRNVVGSFSGDAMTFSAPGRLDGIRQARYVQPAITVAAGNAFEVDRIVVDAVFIEDGE